MQKKSEPVASQHSQLKVLMFGWEFPPHISGGLGTACLGITQSLLRENTDVLFVVPKSYGDEPVPTTCIINASAVALPLSGSEKKTLITRPVVRTVQQKFQIKERTVIDGSAETFSVIEVPAVLDPYHVGQTVEDRRLTQWNYALEQDREITRENSELDHEIAETATPTTYSFSGTYGINLQEEVAKYSDVAKVIAEKECFDVIHAHDWMTFPAGIEAKKISGKPLVVHVHATEIDRSGVGTGKVYELEKQGMDAADRIIAVSDWTKKIVVKHYGIDPDKIEVVHNGINPSNAAAASSSIGAAMGSHVVTFLGRVTHQKGPRYFVEAARKVSEKFPDAHFVIAGSGDLLPQTIDRVAQLRLSKKFHFTGFLTSDWISQVWSMSNVYVMPSVSEPFGITPLEAMQAGVPVIVSNQSGVSEVLPHALKVNFWDTDALAEAICSVLQYQSLSTMLKQKGQKELERLTWRSAAQKINKVYHEIKN